MQRSKILIALGCLLVIAGFLAVRMMFDVRNAEPSVVHEDIPVAVSYEVQQDAAVSDAEQAMREELSDTQGAVVSAATKPTPSSSVPVASKPPATPPVVPTPQAPVVVPPKALPALPVEVNLAVPFVVQAPFRNWDEDHQEFCEEASALMAYHYLKGTKSLTNADADKELMAIKAFEMARFGYFKDTDAQETALILREFYKEDRVTLQENPSVEDMKRLLSQGKVLLMPTAGRKLGNPHFTGAGPRYHMIVIKGYTKDGKFITNDPGTRFGHNYLYSVDTIMEAMRDWNAGNVETGRKVVIVVG